MNTIAPRPGTFQPVCSARERRRSRLVSFLPYLLVLVPGWLWWSAPAAWLRLEMPPAPRAMATPGVSLSYFNGGPVAGADDPRHVLSPMFFSHPSRGGFSGPQLVDEVRLTAPADVVTPPQFIRAAPPFTPAAFGETFRKLIDLVKMPRATAMPSLPGEPVAFRVAAAATGAGYQFSWQDRPEEPVPGIDAASFPASTNDLPWQAVVFLCADGGGAVQRALVETPAPHAELNLHLVRVSRAMQLPASGEEQCRRLVIRYQPAPRPARAGGGA